MAESSAHPATPFSPTPSRDGNLQGLFRHRRRRVGAPGGSANEPDQHFQVVRDLRRSVKDQLRIDWWLVLLSNPGQIGQRSVSRLLVQSLRIPRDADLKRSPDPHFDELMRTPRSASTRTRRTNAISAQEAETTLFRVYYSCPGASAMIIYHRRRRYDPDGQGSLPITRPVYPWFLSDMFHSR